ncbi:MAG: hypothetical protein K1X82_13300 [Bacteroidia bacterium]|nr:hypothetical protein [Bacteroidia bacterium]
MKSSLKFLLFSLFVLSMLAVLIMPSCKHHPDDLVPADTTQNPIDTTTNPIDTLVCDTCPEGVVSFSEDIQPIFNSQCAQAGCHDAATHEEGLVLNTYQNIMATTDIAEKGLGSDVWEALNETGDDMMPPNGPLSNDQLNLIKAWIQQGAQNTTCTHTCGCDTNQVSYSQFVAPKLQSFCIGCHSNSSSQGGVNLSGYANVMTYAQNGKLMKCINWESGVSAMPKGAQKLNDCTISKIQSWINQGSLNN